METLLNILLIAALLIIGIAIWQSWQIVKKGKNGETVDPAAVARLERRLNVIHVCVYVLVVILVFRMYLIFAAR